MLAQAFATLQAFTGSAQSADPVDVEHTTKSTGLALPLPGAVMGTGDPATAPAFDIMAVPGLDIVSDAVDYWVDSTQRCILFWDCLRRSGNAFLGLDDEAVEPSQSDGETEIDLAESHGVRIEALQPDEGVMQDPGKRPIVVFNPRAGTEAGAGHLNDAVRRSLYAGHYVYRVSLDATLFAAEPSPAALEAAVAAVLQRIAQRHPASAAPPCRIARCADMPRLAALSLLSAESVGAALIDAVPSSYWCGLDQESPYRNAGSLLGGQWLASLDRDLGEGRQDGSAAAAAPYVTDTTGRLWAEPYALYAAIDSEEETYLRRAGLRDTLFRRRADDARHHVGGPGLAGRETPAGTMLLDDGSTVDLRTAERPLLLFATDFGRTAAAAILAGQVRRAFGSVQAIRDVGRVVIYAQDGRTGHLCVLVIPGVPQEGRRTGGSQDGRLNALKPGLYELTAGPVPHPDANGTPVQQDIAVTLVPRSFRNEAIFQQPGAARQPAHTRAAPRSEAMDWVYKVLLRPWVRLWSTPSQAETRRELHPMRAWRAALSDANPALTPIKALAALVREDRRPAAQDNDFQAAERALARRVEMVVAALCSMRDEILRALYRLTFNSPVWSLAGR